MRLMDRFSIGTKMTLLACTSAGVALLMTCLGFLAIGIHTLRVAKVRQLEERAKLLALYSSPIITLRNSAAGERLLASLYSDATIETACVYDAERVCVAKWGPVGPSAFPADLDTYRFVGWQHLEVIEPVHAAGQNLGYIFLRANTDDLNAELAKFARTAAYVLAAAMAVAIGMSLRFQRPISRPILALTEAARRISSDGDYSIRVSAQAGAELKTLQDVFNRMLEQVQDSEQALQRAQAGLEDRVTERTKALSQEIQRRQEIQNDLEQAKDAAEAANRAKSEFLANMSHEIRTPLNGILGFTDLLRQNDDPWTDDQWREHLETIHKNGLHLLDLIGNILDLSKIEAGRLEVEEVDCTPREIISDVVDTLSVRAHDAHLTLDLQWSGGAQENMRTDPARLRQLMMNLVSNAIKFTETGGVRVVAKLQKALDTTTLEIEVIDSGIGIPPEKLDVIFDPFTQADSSVTRRYGGTGLGLAICRKIASALGGELTVSSEVGEGSVFAVVLRSSNRTGGQPAARSSAAIVTPRSATAPRVTKLPPVRILVVDDGETNRKLTQLILNRAGAVAETVENGLLAVRAAMAEPYDLILMDMQMPVMDGYSATRELRKAGLEIPIVALTAHAMKGDEEKCLEAGCVGYLTKPVDADQLLAAVAKSLAVVTDFPRAAPAGPTDHNSGPVISQLPLDDPEIREIVEEFVERLGVKLAEMRAALAARDVTELAQLAHWLKGVGGTAGFPKITELAQRLEQLTRENRLSDAEHQLDRICALSERIVMPARV